MARTKSTSIQAHPHHEQAQIDLMQKSYWSLLNSQEIKSIDNRLERRGDSIYQVGNTEHYVKLVFSRDLGIPNLDEIKRLEQEFFSLPYPDHPGAFGCSMGIGLVGFISVFITPVIVLNPILVTDAAIATGLIFAFVLALSALWEPTWLTSNCFTGPERKRQTKGGGRW